MTVDVQMDSDKGDVKVHDADKDALSCKDDRKGPTNDIHGATLASKEEEIPCLPTLNQSKSTEKKDMDEPFQGEQSKVCVSPLREGTAESKVDGQLIKGEDKPCVMVSQKIQDCQSVPCDVEDTQNIAQAGKGYSSNVKSETTTAVDLQSEEKEQSGNSVENFAKSEMDSAQVRENAEDGQNSTHKEQLLFQLPVSEVPPKKKETADEIHQSEKEETVKKILDKAHQRSTEVIKNELKGTEKSNALPTDASENIKMAEKTEVAQPSIGNTPVGNKRQPATPDIKKQSSVTGSGDHHGQARTSAFSEVKMTESDEGTPAEQAAFMKELEVFYRARDVDFKPPKFYGHLLNCLKLWRAVIKLGGYDLVTGSKLWRQVGESFHPPKTCTTVSWTFRIFYEKSLLEYERYLKQIGELQLPEAALSEPSSVDNEGNGHQASGSGRARRDAAARAMQGWHAQRLFSHGEDKNVTSIPKRENKVKSIGSIKQKRPDEVELPVKAQRTETSKQLSATVLDVGPSADWVKINVRETKDCFEVYALVPGLLREEVRVQSDPAGRLVITGQPEQPDNPWGITAFKKVVTLPARIDPLQTSAVVSLHGRLFVRVPFEQPQI